jgi:hypothetical protein
MANHHDSHHDSGTKKPVSFTVPLILGAVTVFIILLFVSLGDPCPHKECCENNEECSKECMEACEKGDHSMHPSNMKHEGEGHHPEKGATSETPEHSTEASTAPAADTTHALPAAEEKHEEGHH